MVVWLCLPATGSQLWSTYARTTYVPYVLEYWGPWHCPSFFGVRGVVPCRPANMAQSLLPESVESFVLTSGLLEDVWRLVAELDFGKLLPDAVSKCDAQGGVAVGATRTNRYRDGTVTVLTLTHVSQSNHSLSWSATTTANSASSGGGGAAAAAPGFRSVDTIELRPVTTRGHVFLAWRTSFDCDSGNLPAGLHKSCRQTKNSFVWHLRRLLQPVPPRPRIGEQVFYNDLHQDYVESLGYKTDSFSFWATDHLRMSGIYWGIAAMSLIKAETRMDCRAIVAWVLSCQNTDGGFGGNGHHDSHILYTLSAVQVLAICNAEQDPRFKRDACARYVAALQQPDGSFFGDEWGEIDTRFSYCGLSCLALLGRLDLIDVPNAAQWLARCHNLDGGFGSCPGAESHAGQIFTCVGALAIAHSLHLVDADALGWWLCERQASARGDGGARGGGAGATGGAGACAGAGDALVVLVAALQVDLVGWVSTACTRQGLRTWTAGRRSQ